MIKLKFLVEAKKEKTSKEPSYPEIIMLPDTVMQKENFIKFLKDVYDAKIEFNSRKIK